MFVHGDEEFDARTLLQVCVRDIAQPMVNSWVDAFTSKVALNDRLQVRLSTR